MPSIVFMGTPDFAIASMNAIHNEFGLTAVVTLPDKPSGRGQQIKPTPVKSAASALHIPVLTPTSLKDPEFIKALSALKPDIICVVAFRILPKEVYSIARLGAFNIHGSILPKYRGAAPVQWAIINGEKVSGVTSFLLNDIVDTGNIIDTRKIDITNQMTAGELFDALTPLGAELAVSTCKELLAGNVTPHMQDDSLASPAPKLYREQCHVHFDKSALNIKNFIHGVNPRPGAWCIFNSKTLKLLKAEIVEGNNIQQAHFEIQKDNFLIGCNTGTISITVLQEEGKPAMKTEDFLRGYRGPHSGVLE